MTGNPIRRMAGLAFVIPVLALLLAMPGTTYAQRMTAELNGTVVDESGGVIPGADVVLINEDTGSNGEFFAEAIKRRGLAKVIGMRTWGGAVGIEPHQDLVDGGVTTPPTP